MQETDLVRSACQQKALALQALKTIRAERDRLRETISHEIIFYRVVAACIADNYKGVKLQEIVGSMAVRAIRLEKALEGREE